MFDLLHDFLPLVVWLSSVMKLVIVRLIVKYLVILLRLLAFRVYYSYLRFLAWWFGYVKKW